MFTTIAILLITLLTISFFHFRCSLMASATTLMSAVFGSILAFNYYQTAADFVLENGYTGQWAPAGCFVVVFIFGFAALRAATDALIRANVDFGKMPKLIANLIFGALTGLMLSGHLLVALGLAPLGSGRLYSRYDAAIDISVSNPLKPHLNTDGMVSGLFSWFSQGSLSSGKSFGVLNADFVNRNHLNRCTSSESVWIITSPKSLSLPPDSKKPVRIWNIPEVGQVAVIRTGICSKAISDGGAANGSNDIAFTPAQVRIVCKAQDNAQALSGTGTPVYAVGLIENKKLVKKKMGETISISGKDIKKQTAWIDLAFQIPQNMQPILLGFKNAMIELPAAVPTSEEIETALEAEDSPLSSSAPPAAEKTAQ